MEKSLEQLMDNLTNVAGVNGVICSDTQGLCIHNTGSIQTKAAGYISSLTKHASQLEPETNRYPVIVLESDTSNLLIQWKEGAVMAISKHANKPGL